MVKKLSVAEQQMVEIAKSLSSSPKVMAFDEPTATISISLVIGSAAVRLAL